MKNREVVLLCVIVASYSIFYSVLTHSILTHYTLKVSKREYHQIWINSNDITVNKTTVTRYYLKFHWKQETILLLRDTNEFFRSKTASCTIQWAIDHTTGLLKFTKGKYVLNQTIRLDSYMIIDGQHSQFTFTGTSPIFDVKNGSYVVYFKSELHGNRR